MVATPTEKCAHMKKLMKVSALEATQARLTLCKAARIVVKVGTHTLASKVGKPNLANMKSLVAQVAALRAEGREVVVVSSGAVGMGLSALGLKVRPKRLEDLQMAAAIGQTRLMHTYQELFAAHGLLVGQLLLTKDDFHDRRRNLNARATLRNLLESGVIPIVNENDTVSVDEIRFGDNDMLASHISMLVDAEVLVLLTTVNGLQDRSGKRFKRIPVLGSITQSTKSLTSETKGSLSSGGMSSKLEAARLAQCNGIAVVIADGSNRTILQQVFSGADQGTLVLPDDPQVRLARKRWLAFVRRSKGEIRVDAGAATALTERNTSLLPVGITGVVGDFVAGDLVKICTSDGATIAKGLVNYTAVEVRLLKGCRSAEIVKILGARQFDEVVHRDNLVVLKD